MGYVSSIIKGQSTSSKSGIWWQEEKILERDDLSGKYQSVTHYSDGNYAKVWYNGDKFDPVATYTDRYCREHKLGKYAEKVGNSSSASSAGQPKTFAGKLGSVLGHFALAAVADGIEKASANGAQKPKKVLPKPKSARPKSASATSPTGGLKSLLSEKRSGILKKARPSVAESRTGLLGRLKSGTAKKGTGLLGGGSKTSVGPKKGGLLGGGSKASAAPKKGGLLGGGTKSAAPKKGGLLGGGSKASAAPKKGGLLGGGVKKASGMSLGKKRR